MKITIEPTDHVDETITVSVTSPSDDEDIEAAVELFRAALLAWGFLPTTVEKALGKP